eukprot:GHVU01047131.1.p1 GENE.GHVU01047131.1~~GHVU01047131.1.p1  ORF type:complete len:148 (+),score=11.53 GHVU01047131.1:721-1164(+)
MITRLGLVKPSSQVAVFDGCGADSHLFFTLVTNFVVFVVCQDGVVVVPSRIEFDFKLRQAPLVIAGRARWHPFLLPIFFFLPPIFDFFLPFSPFAIFRFIKCLLFMRHCVGFWELFRGRGNDFELEVSGKGKILRPKSLIVAMSRSQ